MRLVLHAFAAALIIVSLASSTDARSHPSLVLKWEQIPEFPNTLVLRLENPDSTARCVPDIDTKERISFIQFGTRVGRFWETNRAVLEWRGADLISGMIVVPPRRAVTIYYDLNDWMLKRGRTTASVDLSEYECLEFFRNNTPRFARVLSSFNFDAPLSIAPKD